MSSELAAKIAMLVEKRVKELDEVFMDPVEKLDSKNFDRTLAREKLVVVNFTTEWCNPCKAYMPVFRRVARKYRGKGVVFAVIDTDRDPEIADRYHVDNIPTTIFFVDGHVADVVVGVMTEQRLIDKIENILSGLRE